MRVIAANEPVPMVPEPFNYAQPGFIQPVPAEPVEVADNSYYRRRLASGELLLVADTQPVGRSRAKSIAKGGEQ